MLGTTVAAAGVFAIARGRWKSRAGEELTVADAMTRHPARVDPRDSAERAAARMAEEGVGALAVCDGTERPVGVVTDRDLVVRVLAQAADPRRVTVGQCLEGDLETVPAEAPLSEAARRMGARGVRRLPVLRGGRLTGMLTLADIAARDSLSAASVERGLARTPADVRSAAWLFRRPYRGSDGAADDTARRNRVVDGQLTEITRGMLADRRDAPAV